jgi:predicted TIM-barrel fold metal-dependent hydrolase
MPAEQSPAVPSGAPSHPASVLPFIAAQPLTDHHCHGVLAEGGDLEELLTEGDGGRGAGGTAFDSLPGLAFRRWCPPVLGLAAHAPVDQYAARRAELGGAEVNRRFLAASGLGALIVDTGYTPAELLSPAQTAAFAGPATAAFEIVRLEQVAESLAARGTSPRDFPDAFRSALAERTSRPGVVGLKSIAAYRVGLDLAAQRPSEAEVIAATGRWIGAGRPDGPGPAHPVLPRLAEEVLHRFFIWTGADLGLPIQFHVGYGDRDVDLHRCNPLLLTPLLRALEPSGVPVMLLHNYPYHREAGYLAQVFPNVHADLGLATHNVGRRAPALLAEALEMVPFGKFLFSSDAFGLAELYYLGTLLFRQALSRFLGTMLDADDITLADAERITRMIATGNAARVYGLLSDGSLRPPWQSSAR